MHKCRVYLSFYSKENEDDHCLNALSNILQCSAVIYLNLTNLGKFQKYAVQHTGRGILGAVELYPRNIHEKIARGL